MIEKQCEVCNLELAEDNNKYCKEHSSSHVLSQTTQPSERVKNGLCKSCTSPLSENSSVFCEEHLKANRDRGVRDRKRRRKLKICRSCSQPLSKKSKTWCEEHRIQQNEKSLNNSRQKRGLIPCIECGNIPRADRRRRCEDCQTKHNIKKSQVCRRTDCESPVETKHFCRLHANEENQKLKARRENLRQNNKCIFCFTEMPKASAFTLCHMCRAKQRLQRRSVSTGNVMEAQ